MADLNKLVDELSALVITSYSIHYTKLYDESRARAKFGARTSGTVSSAPHAALAIVRNNFV